MKHGITIEEARELLLDFILPLPSEIIPIDNAHQRVVAKNIAATLDLPPYPCSALDGYALHQQDLQSKDFLTCIETLSPGEIPQTNLEAGKTVRVVTGGPVPRETACVIAWEQVQMTGKQIKLNKAMHQGDNIKPRGEDFIAGQQAIPLGKQLSAGDMGILSALGCNQIAVYRQPKVAIFCLGPEIIPANQSPLDGQIRDSNGAILAALLQKQGAVLTAMYYFSAQGPNLQDILAQSLQQNDLILTIGAAATNTSDQALTFLRAAGVTMAFWGMQAKPGSHSGGGHKENTTIISLAGNPGACMVGYHLLTVPVLKVMQGLSPHPVTLQVPCNQAFAKQGGPRRFLRGSLTWDSQGLSVNILPGQKSSMLHSLSSCNALIELPPGHPPLQAGDLVTAYPIDH